jgi:inner membrane protein
MQQTGNRSRHGQPKIPFDLPWYAIPAQTRIRSAPRSYNRYNYFRLLMPMPTIMSHVAVPLALGIALGPRIISRRLLIAGTVASALPDLDVIGFRLHVDYADAFGHRGATHSLMFAFLLGMLALTLASRLHANRLPAFLFVAFSAASHGLLDTFTNGGLGVGLLWPLSEQRFFAPWRVIEVSPIGAHFFSNPRGVAVMYSELLWVWLPAICVCALLYALRWRYAVQSDK